MITILRRIGDELDFLSLVSNDKLAKPALDSLSLLEAVQFYDPLLFNEGRAVSPGRINEPSPAATASDSPRGLWYLHIFHLPAGRSDAVAAGWGIVGECVGACPTYQWPPPRKLTSSFTTLAKEGEFVFDLRRHQCPLGESNLRTQLRCYTGPWHGWPGDVGLDQSSRPDQGAQRRGSGIWKLSYGNRAGTALRLVRPTQLPLRWGKAPTQQCDNATTDADAIRVNQTTANPVDAVAV